MQNRFSKYFFGMAFGACALVSAATNLHAQQKSDLDLIRERGVLRVGAAISQPLYIKEPGSSEWTGIAPDIANILAKYLKVKVEFVETQWGTAAAGLQSGRFDLMAALNATPERALVVDFTRSIGPLKLGIMSVGPQAAQFKTWADIDRSNVRFAAVDGTASALTVEKQLKTKKLIRVPGFDALTLELESGRSDIALMDTSVASSFMKNRGKGTYVVPEPVIATDTDLAVRKGSDDFRRWLDITIRYIELQGDLEQVWEKWIPTK